jgi:serine phosphatase RsbU (regulator of sigma subunit)
LCYTDGLVEQEDEQGRDFGTDILGTLLRDFSLAGPEPVNEALIAAFNVHRGDQPYLDDIAVLTCRIK